MRAQRKIRFDPRAVVIVLRDPVILGFAQEEAAACCFETIEGVQHPADQNAEHRSLGFAVIVFEIIHPLLLALGFAGQLFFIMAETNA